jgi:hypothetical protein
MADGGIPKDFLLPARRVVLRFRIRFLDAFVWGRAFIAIFLCVDAAESHRFVRTSYFYWRSVRRKGGYLAVSGEIEADRLALGMAPASYLEPCIRLAGVFERWLGRSPGCNGFGETPKQDDRRSFPRQTERVPAAGILPAQSPR